MQVGQVSGQLFFKIFCAALPEAVNKRSLEKVQLIPLYLSSSDLSCQEGKHRGASLPSQSHPKFLLMHPM